MKPSRPPIDTLAPDSHSDAPVGKHNHSEWRRKWREALAAPVAIMALTSCATGGEDAEPPARPPVATAFPDTPSTRPPADMPKPSQEVSHGRLEYSDIDPTPAGIRVRHAELIETLFRQHGSDEKKGGEAYEGEVKASVRGGVSSGEECMARYNVSNYAGQSAVNIFLQCVRSGGDIREVASAMYLTDDPSNVSRLAQPNTAQEVVGTLNNERMKLSDITVAQYDKNGRVTTYTENAAGVLFNYTGRPDNAPVTEEEKREAIEFARQTLGGEGLGGSIARTYS